VVPLLKFQTSTLTHLAGWTVRSSRQIVELKHRAGSFGYSISIFCPGAIVLFTRSQ